MSERSFDSQGGISSFYTSSLLPSLDQSPPVIQYNNSRTQPLSAAPMMASPMRTKKSAVGRSLLTTNYSAIQSPSSQPSTPTSFGVPAISVLRPVSSLTEQIRNAQAAPTQSRSQSQTSSSPSQYKQLNLYSHHHPNNYNRLPPRPVLTHSSRSVPSSAQSSPTNSELTSPLSSSIASFVAPAHHDDVTPHTCDLLGKAGESNTNSAFLVRSRVDGKLSIFKPADGEAFEEAVAYSRQQKNARMHIRTTDSPSCSPSQSPFPSEPSTPLSPHSFSLDAPKTPMRKGVVWGDCALKEKAVFVLDSPDHFSGVPRSDAVRIMIPRNTDDIPVIDPTSVQVSTNEQQPEDVVSVPPTPRPSQKSQPIAIPSAGRTSIVNRHNKNDFFGRRHGRTNDHDDSDDSDEDFHESNHDLVEVYGSLQEFIPHIGSADDVGSSLFSADDVHRIGILDVRILNLDRHHGNMLVKRDARGFFHLVPIDHGYVLPSYQELSDVHLEWTYWKQAAVPFSKTSLDYIASLNPLSDAAKLKSLGIRGECIISMVFATLLMQHGAARGLTLQQIARLVQREKKSFDLDIPMQTVASDTPLDISSEPSSLERIVARVTRQVIKERLMIDGNNSSEFVLLPLAYLERSASTQMLLPSPSSSSFMPSPSPLPSPSFGPLSSSLALDTHKMPASNTAEMNLFLIVQAIDEEIERVYPLAQQPLAITPTAAAQ